MGNGPSADPKRPAAAAAAPAPQPTPHHPLPGAAPQQPQQQSQQPLPMQKKAVATYAGPREPLSALAAASPAAGAVTAAPVAAAAAPVPAPAVPFKGAQWPAIGPAPVVLLATPWRAELSRVLSGVMAHDVLALVRAYLPANGCGDARAAFHDVVAQHVLPLLCTGESAGEVAPAFQTLPRVPQDALAYTEPCMTPLWWYRCCHGGARHIGSGSNQWQRGPWEYRWEWTPLGFGHNGYRRVTAKVWVAALESALVARGMLAPPALVPFDGTATANSAAHARALDPPTLPALLACDGNTLLPSGVAAVMDCVVRARAACAAAAPSTTASSFVSASSPSPAAAAAAAAAVSAGSAGSVSADAVAAAISAADAAGAHAVVALLAVPVPDRHLVGGTSPPEQLQWPHVQRRIAELHDIVYGGAQQQRCGGVRLSAAASAATTQPPGDPHDEPRLERMLAAAYAAPVLDAMPAADAARAARQLLPRPLPGATGGPPPPALAALAAARELFAALRELALNADAYELELGLDVAERGGAPAFDFVIQPKAPPRDALPLDMADGYCVSATSDGEQPVADADGGGDAAPDPVAVELQYLADAVARCRAWQAAVGTAADSRVTVHKLSNRSGRDYDSITFDAAAAVAKTERCLQRAERWYGALTTPFAELTSLQALNRAALRTYRGSAAQAATLHRLDVTYAAMQWPRRGYDPLWRAELEPYLTAADRRHVRGTAAPSAVAAPTDCDIISGSDTRGSAAAAAAAAATAPDANSPSSYAADPLPPPVAMGLDGYRVAGVWAHLTPYAVPPPNRYAWAARHARQRERGGLRVPLPGFRLALAPPQPAWAFRSRG